MALTKHFYTMISVEFAWRMRWPMVDFPPFGAACTTPEIWGKVWAEREEAAWQLVKSWTYPQRTWSIPAGPVAMQANQVMDAVGQQIGEGLV